MGSVDQKNPFNTWTREEAVTTTKTYDRYGRELGEGDVVHLLGKNDIMWRVVKAAPVMNPQAPAGLVELVLQAVFVTGVPGGQKVLDILKVQDASDRALAQAKRMGGEGSAS